MSNGMNHYVFVVYTNALASLLLFPFTFLFKGRRPPLSFTLLGKFFLLSLAGNTIVQNCIFTGVNYSSPTLGSAMSNLIPAFTFLLSLIFRLEKVDLRSQRSLVKILGTIVLISGALVVTFYKGPTIVTLQLLQTRSSQGLSASYKSQLLTHIGSKSNWVIGACFFAIASFSASVWYVAQAVLIKGFPSETIVFFYCLFGSIQSALVAAREESAWILKTNIELITIIYTAVFGYIVTFSVHIWFIHKKVQFLLPCLSLWGLLLLPSLALSSLEIVYTLECTFSLPLCAISPPFLVCSIVFFARIDRYCNWEASCDLVETPSQKNLEFEPSKLLSDSNVVLCYFFRPLRNYRILGSVTIVLGFYAVIWSQEERSNHGEDEMLLSNSENNPLLEGQSVTNRC